MNTKAGYVAIIGKPNSGKSTLMNAIIGNKLSIVTHKAQTTRKRVLGIHSSDNSQIIFLDTPGLLEPQHELHKSMVSYIEKSIKEAEVLLILIDISNFRDINTYFKEEFSTSLRKQQKPIIFVINKIDTLSNVKEVLPVINSLSEYYDTENIIPISALRKSGINDLVNAIEKLLPISEFYYDPELLSTQPERFFVSEMIRENILKLYQQEVPYSTEVAITEFKERKNGKWFIAADIIIERSSQKKIIIGVGGSKIKKLGQTSRKDIEEHLQKEVYLELFVKVREKWRNKKGFLESLGY